MKSRGNIYQNLIFAAQDYLDSNGELPANCAELAQFAGATEEEFSTLFNSSEDLREGVIYHAVTLLNDAVRAGVVAANTSDPIVQLHAIADSYLGWAESNPGLFRLLVTGLNGPIEPDSALHRYTSSMRDLYTASWSRRDAWAFWLRIPTSRSPR